MPKRKPGAYDARGEASRKGLAEGLDDGRIKRFLAHVWKKEKLTGAEGHCIMNLCMAATYDPDPRAPLGFRVPFNLESGELHRAALEQVARARPDQPGRRNTGTISSRCAASTSIAAGATSITSITARASCRSASPRPASGTRYEEFDDDHSDIDYRMDVSLPFLYRALKP